MLFLLSNLLYFSFFVAFFWAYYFCLFLVWLSYFCFENAYSYYILVVPQKTTWTLGLSHYCVNWWLLLFSGRCKDLRTLLLPSLLKCCFSMCVLVFQPHITLLVLSYAVNVHLGPCMYLPFLLFICSCMPSVPSAWKTSSFRAGCLLANSFNFGLSENSLSHSILKCQWGKKWHLS